MNPTEITRLLYRCHCIQSGNTRLLDEITPEGMRVDVSNHSTATHCSIYLCMAGEPDLLIWYKTNWISSSYLFNEKGKVSGTQANCQFADPLLTKLFEDAAAAIDDIDRRKEAKKEAEAGRKKHEKNDLVSKYQKRFEQ